MPAIGADLLRFLGPLYLYCEPLPIIRMRGRSSSPVHQERPGRGIKSNSRRRSNKFKLSEGSGR